MHDPSTLAFSIKIPIGRGPALFKRDRDEGKKEWRFYSIADIWHEDPCRGPGGDDSCGWFKRAHHGDKMVLAKIARRFEEDWDRVFNYRDEDSSGEPVGPIKSTYFRGLFCPNGDPRMSVHGIALNLFFVAAGEYFQSTGQTNWLKARRWMQSNLFDILMFAENPTDSLYDSITRTFSDDCSTSKAKRERSERIDQMASIIYGWILRREQRWWQHPRWHVHHWRIHIHVWYRLKRCITKRCNTCGKRISPRDNGVVSHSWSGDGPLTCGKCSGPACAAK